MSVTDYAERIRNEVRKLKDTNGEKMAEKGIDFKFIDEYVNRFVNAADAFSAELGKIERDDKQKQRYIAKNGTENFRQKPV